MRFHEKKKKRIPHIKTFQLRTYMMDPEVCFVFVNKQLTIYLLSGDGAKILQLILKFDWSQKNKYKNIDDAF